jgi:hypothetical protein
VGRRAQDAALHALTQREDSVGSFQAGGVAKPGFVGHLRENDGCLGKQGNYLNPVSGGVGVTDSVRNSLI